MKSTISLSSLILGLIFFSSTYLIDINFTYGQIVADAHHHPISVLVDSPGSFSTHKDTIPNFTASPTITSKQSGNWFDVSTWTQGRIPRINDVVRVEPGHVVKYDGASDSALAALGVKGILKFDTTKNTKLKVGTILVYREGRMDVGVKSSPIASNVKAEIIIADRPLATSVPDSDTSAYDPLQYGAGIVALGEVNMHGKAKAPTWSRLSKEPKAGHITLTLESTPSGWSVGDKLVLPDTRQTPITRISSRDTPKPIDLQLEELYISAISENTITLSRPLIYDHLGAYDTDGNLLALPHIGNLTRNIVIRSENPKGVRGHVMFTERAKVDVRYTSFIGMGRTTAEPLDNTVIKNGEVTHIGTNQIGRYPIHFHHLMGPVNDSNTGYQFIVAGISIEDGEKWGITVHNSHFGFVDNNVVYNVDGAGIMTEEGNEKENVFSNNFVVKVGTMIESMYKPRYGGVAGLDRSAGFGDFGYEGSALWFTGLDNYVTGNVAANSAFAGLMYNARSRGFVINQPNIPKFRGADIGNPTHWILKRHLPAPSIKLSKNNEAYANSEGAWISFSSVVGHISDLMLWHNKQIGLYSQRNISASYSKITIINDQKITNKNSESLVSKGISLYNHPYQSGHVALKNIRVEGFGIGIDLPAFIQNGKPEAGVNITPVTVVDDAYLRNFVNISERNSRYVPKYTLLRDIEFIQNPGPPNKYLSLTPQAILTGLETTYREAAVTVPSRTFVYNYNKQSGNDFEVFFKEQAPDYVMKLREYPKGNVLSNQNCPEVGLTNQECSDRFNVAYLAKVAPCVNDDKPEIDGYTCSITDSSTFEEILNQIPELTLDEKSISLPSPEKPLPLPDPMESLLLLGI